MENEELLLAIRQIVQEEIRPVKADISGLKEGQESLRQDVTGLKEGQDSLRQDVTGLKEGQESLRQDFTGLKEGQESLRQDFTGLKEGQESLRQDVTGLKEGQESLRQDVTGLKEGQDSLQNQVTKINIKLENDIGRKLSALFDGHQLNAQKLDHIGKTVDAINEAYAATDTIARVNTAEIKRLKAKIQ